MLNTLRRLGDPSREEIPVLITTNSRVYCGWIDLRNVHGQSIWYVRQARNARVWGTTEGVEELAVKGPNSSSELDMFSDMIVVHDVRVVRPLTDDAIKAWGMTPPAAG